MMRLRKSMVYPIFPKMFFKFMLYKVGLIVTYEEVIQNMKKYLLEKLGYHPSIISPSSNGLHPFRNIVTSNKYVLVPKC